MTDSKVRMPSYFAIGAGVVKLSSMGYARRSKMVLIVGSAASMSSG